MQYNNVVKILTHGTIECAWFMYCVSDSAAKPNLQDTDLVKSHQPDFCWLCKFHTKYGKRTEKKPEGNCPQDPANKRSRHTAWEPSMANNRQCSPEDTHHPA